MFFWFIGTAILAVGFVFRDPRFDFRLLIIGSVLPLLDGLVALVLPGVRILHSITTAIVVLAVLMLLTAGRKPIRKALLGLPIGMFFHLVFDGAWNDTDVFWWPFTGFGFSETPFPVADRGVVSFLLEAVGIALCMWLWRLNRLSQVDRRRRFIDTGHLVVSRAA